MEMTQAIREGKFSVDDLSRSLDDFKDTVVNTFEGKQDPPYTLVSAMNNLKQAGKELGDTIMQTLAPVFDKAAEAAKKLAGWFSGLTARNRPSSLSEDWLPQ